MPWAICIKNIETGKMELVCEGFKADLDDPRYADEVHIVPTTEADGWIRFGVHDFKRDCCCHPKIRNYVNNRTLILHSEAVN